MLPSGRRVHVPADPNWAETGVGVRFDDVSLEARPLRTVLINRDSSGTTENEADTIALLTSLS